MWDLLWTDLRLATLDPALSSLWGAIDDGALAVENGRIAWIGRRADLPGGPRSLARRVVPLDGRWMTPGLIDCHTHLVWGGNRAPEFERRLEGESYASIARAGGGIVSTVRATREASEDTLFEAARRRLERLLAEGVTTVEIKSGYGLDVETEVRMLRVARRLGRELPVRVRTTFLGAHAVPPERCDDADGYVDLVAGPMLDAVVAEGLADAVDAFCEGIAFSVDQCDRVFRAARDRDLPVKAHAEQLSRLGGAALVARHGGLSADHLEHLDAEGARAMAEAGTVAVLLPGAFYVLKETHRPPVDLLRREGVPIAVATDCNPGSSPIASLRLVLHMACTFFGLTAEEAVAGATRNAARALGLGSEVGTLEVGKVADLAIWDVDVPAQIVAEIGTDLLHGLYRGSSESPRSASRAGTRAP